MYFIYNVLEFNSTQSQQNLKYLLPDLWVISPRLAHLFNNIHISSNLSLNLTWKKRLWMMKILHCYIIIILLRSSVSNGRPYCYSIVSFSLLRSSVSNGRPYCYCIVSFSLFLLLFFFFLPILCRGFLGIGWVDFHEIFRTDR